MQEVLVNMEDRGSVSDFIRYDLNMYKEKHTLEKRCKQLENVLGLYNYNIDEFHIMAYKNPYLYIVESFIPKCRVTVEGNSALIEFFDERNSILYNFITCRYLECDM